MVGIHVPTSKSCGAVSRRRHTPPISPGCSSSAASRRLPDRTGRHNP